MAGSSAPQWFPLLPLEEDEAAAPEEPRMPRRKTDEEDRRGPALLLRVQSFDAERLEIAESRERLFHHYSANGDYLLPDECDRMLADVASGWRPRPDADAIESTHGMRGWRLCVAHVLAAFGCYKPDMPLLHHLMYFHTLFWVCCRAPDEEHIPVVHRLYFVVLSVSFNLLVLVLFMATDVSLVTVHCQPLQACSSLEVMLWRAAEVAKLDAWKADILSRAERERRAAVRALEAAAAAKAAAAAAAEAAAKAAAEVAAEEQAAAAAALRVSDGQLVSCRLQVFGKHSCRLSVGLV
jgi:hypothetical protein